MIGIEHLRSSHKHHGSIRLCYLFSYKSIHTWRSGLERYRAFKRECGKGERRCWSETNWVKDHMGMSLMISKRIWLLNGQETRDCHQVLSFSLFFVRKWDCEIYFSRMCILSDCEMESHLWRVVDVTLVERPDLVHCYFVLVMEEVANTL